MSPHFDDVCFSLGGLTARRRAGILVTLCSLSAFAEQRGNLPTDPAQRTEFVSALRRDEDDRFAAHCGLTPVRLGLQEATLRGHSPFDTPRAQEVSPLFARTIAAALEPPLTE